MFYEIRCGDLIKGREYFHFTAEPKLGDVVIVGSIDFVVYEIKIENSKKVVELAVL